ncbi:hypothetical protein ACLB2K_047166 [Fragaria x ananassa]
MRVRVDVSKPLKKWVWFKPIGLPKSECFDLEYERLPHFCFFCGLVDHTEGKCARRISGELSESAFNGLMKADRMEAWLFERLQANANEMGSSRPGWRFGLHQLRKTGWIMSAPDLATVGLTRTREERDEFVEGGGWLFDGMEIDRDAGRDELQNPCSPKRGRLVFSQNGGGSLKCLNEGIRV